MLDNLKQHQFTQMTAIQEESLPHLLNQKDIIAQAKTGSGKTLAFSITVLHRLEVKKFRVQSLVLCPTRELADQVAKEMRKVAKFTHNIKILTLSGGVAFGPQYGSLQHGAHIIVGTPGRVLKHLKKGSLELKHLETFVLDEADKMLDMGFLEEIEDIISFMPKDKQTLLFSATYSEEVLEISKNIQKDPISIQTHELESANKIDQYFYKVDESQKIETVIDVLKKHSPENVIIFCNTKIKTDEVANTLYEKGVDALAIHGDLEQFERTDVLVQFANGSCPVLIATDVAARGLDIKELSMVINFDLPHSEDTYTHRIGRTGRAGSEGVACTLVEDDQSSTEYIHEIANIEPLDETESFTMQSKNITLIIEGGKKDKLRAGDILGALTSNQQIASKSIGKIDIYDRQSYVAIDRDSIDSAYKLLKEGKIKGRKFSVWILENH